MLKPQREYDINGDMIFFDSPFDVTLDNINTSTEEIHVIAIGNEDTVDFIEDQQTCGDPYTIEDFKPYLQSMSSMTEKEKKKFKKVVYDSMNIDNVSAPVYVADWLYSKHLDVHGLILKGLAIEVTPENNPYKV